MYKYRPITGELTMTKGQSATLYTCTQAHNLLTVPAMYPSFIYLFAFNYGQVN